MKLSKLVHHFLENSADTYPEKDAFFVNENWYNYAYIEKKANQLARYLINSGVNKGDRVAFYIENSVEYVITYYAILKTGAITVALNTENLAPNIDYILKDCGVDIVVTNSKMLKKICSQTVS